MVFLVCCGLLVIPGLVCVAQVLHLLLAGTKRRMQEPTEANPVSSRSHAVFQVSVSRRDRARDRVQSLHVGKLSMVDLAGSERASHTQNRGQRMLEGAKINRSLLALGNCINALVEKGSKAFIPYRDSKLTRLLKVRWLLSPLLGLSTPHCHPHHILDTVPRLSLSGRSFIHKNWNCHPFFVAPMQDSLGGNCRTVMIAAVAPTVKNFEETLNTLKYANRAKNIKTTVRVHAGDVACCVCVCVCVCMYMCKCIHMYICTCACVCVCVCVCTLPIFCC